MPRKTPTNTQTTGPQKPTDTNEHMDFIRQIYQPTNGINWINIGAKDVK